MGFLNKLKEVASDGVNNIITSLPAKSVLVKQVASVNYENMLVSVNIGRICACLQKFNRSYSIIE